MVGEVSEGRGLDAESDFAEKLAAHLVNTGKKQRVLAEELGVSQQTVSKWLHGETQPRIRNYLRMARLFSDLGYVDEFSLPGSGESDESDELTGDYKQKLLGAFIVRAEQGPPLNEIEAALVRDLLDGETSH